MNGKRTTCWAGELEAGSGLLDVGTDEMEAEFTTYDGSHWLSSENKEAPSLRCDSLSAKRRRAKHERLERLSAINTRRCEQFVVYGSDVHNIVDCLCTSTAAVSAWSGVGYMNCLAAQFDSLVNRDLTSMYWTQTDALKRAVYTPERRLEQLRDVLDRYVYISLVCFYWQLPLCTTGGKQTGSSRVTPHQVLVRYFMCHLWH